MGSFTDTDKEVADLVTAMSRIQHLRAEAELPCDPLGGCTAAGQSRDLIRVAGHRCLVFRQSGLDDVCATEAQHSGERVKIVLRMVLRTPEPASSASDLERLNAQQAIAS